MTLRPGARALEPPTVTVLAGYPRSRPIGLNDPDWLSLRKAASVSPTLRNPEEERFVWTLMREGRALSIKAFPKP